MTCLTSSFAFATSSSKRSHVTFPIRSDMAITTSPGHRAHHRSWWVNRITRHRFPARVTPARHREPEVQHPRSKHPTGARQPTCKTDEMQEANGAFAYDVSETPFRDACRARQALTRHRLEQ